MISPHLKKTYFKHLKPCSRRNFLLHGKINFKFWNLFPNPFYILFYFLGIASERVTLFVVSEIEKGEGGFLAYLRRRNRGKAAGPKKEVFFSQEGEEREGCVFKLSKALVLMNIHLSIKQTDTHTHTKPNQLLCFNSALFFADFFPENLKLWVCLLILVKRKITN